MIVLKIIQICKELEVQLDFKDFEFICQNVQVLTDLFVYNIMPTRQTYLNFDSDGGDMDFYIGAYFYDGYNMGESNRLIELSANKNNIKALIAMAKQNCCMRTDISVKCYNSAIKLGYNEAIILLGNLYSTCGVKDMAQKTFEMAYDKKYKQSYCAMRLVHLYYKDFDKYCEWCVIYFLLSKYKICDYQKFKTFILHTDEKYLPIYEKIYMVNCYGKIHSYVELNDSILRVYEKCNNKAINKQVFYDIMQHKEKKINLNYLYNISCIKKAMSRIAHTINYTFNGFNDIAIQFKN